MPKVGNDPRNGSWERQFEWDGALHLPDCRVKYLDRDAHRVKIGRQVFDTVYCADCGGAFMGVNPDCPHVFFWCDGCYERRGFKAPPGAVQIPEF
jgi:hypothetical protein